MRKASSLRLPTRWRRLNWLFFQTLHRCGSRLRLDAQIGRFQKGNGAQHLESDPCKAGFVGSKGLGCSDTQVNDPSLDEWAAIIDANHDRFARFEVGDTGPCVKWELLVGSCEIALTIVFPVGRQSSDPCSSIPGCDAFLHISRIGGINLHLGLGFRVWNRFARC